MKFLARALPFASFFPAVAAFAQTSPGNFNGVTVFFTNIVTFINFTLVPLIFAIAFLLFIWGVATYFIFSRDSETAKEKGRDYMIWGIAGFVIMVSVWGIVNLLSSGLGLNQQDIQGIPNVNLTNN
ncbi:hypothetical protein GW943_01010 [Candidatus Parcubacteria bacterium]|uniref:TIGR03745 family integrating conjugative element membrane protein n=1 Tax=Candidatus Kaiserbacteria bacterium CG10_big_fil_rev_8_21_14_0_10_47_16 TaxID=1974608 RepID=A0A2H0UDD9_9BACT|nr:hypothetical protein [Candidatus Parcubacteria bacterium]PIR84407.1 MAG: hypothetical protein COU16_02390 [Candidatus Kaiserbacteria bacterium CG10_big_fil_rev_8_21_14_0_10_47_16]